MQDDLVLVTPPDFEDGRLSAIASWHQLYEAPFGPEPYPSSERPL
jgi:hypothetical protein